MRAFILIKIKDRFYYIILILNYLMYFYLESCISNAFSQNDNQELCTRTVLSSLKSSLMHSAQPQLSVTLKISHTYSGERRRRLQAMLLGKSSFSLLAPARLDARLFSASTPLSSSRREIDTESLNAFHRRAKRV